MIINNHNLPNMSNLGSEEEEDFDYGQVIYNDSEESGDEKSEFDSNINSNTGTNSNSGTKSLIRPFTQPLTQPLIQTQRPRSLSVNSKGSDTVREFNFKCGACKQPFLLDKNQKMIRCVFCGYRILYKLRTKKYITYKTE